MAAKQIPASYSLPKWKRIPQLDEKGQSGAKDTLMVVVLEATDKEVKDLLLKIEIYNSYEANNKALNSHDVKLLHETLKYLEVNPEGLTKEGTCYSIIKRLYTLVPYSCEGCLRDIGVC